MQQTYNTTDDSANNPMQYSAGHDKTVSWQDRKHTPKSHHRRNMLKTPKRIDNNVYIYSTSDILADQTDVAERYENWLRLLEPIWHKLCRMVGKTDRWYNIYNSVDYAAVMWQNLTPACVDLIRIHMYQYDKILTDTDIQKLARMSPPNYASITRATERTQIDTAVSARRYAIGGFISNIAFTLIIGVLVIVLLVLLVPIINKLSSVITDANTCINNGNTAFINLNSASLAIQNSPLVKTG